MIERMGANAWKGVYSLFAIAGFVLIVWGFGQARVHPLVLYTPPLWLRHLNALFMLVALVLLAAAYVPRNHIKARLGHPMLAAVKVWAFGHLLAVGMLHDVVLFGPFLVWAVIAFVAARRRDRAAGTTYPTGTLIGDGLTVLVGVALWVVFAFWLHRLLIGVNPFA